MTTKNKRKKLRKIRKMGLLKWMEEKNIDPLVLYVTSTYVGERCQGCGIAFASVRDVFFDAVWWPWKKGRMGHKRCYQRATAQSSITSSTNEKPIC